MKFTQITFVFLFFSLSGNGQSLEQADAHAKKVAYSSDFISKAQELAAPFTNEEDQARAIFTYIIENISYDTKRYEEIQSNRRTKIRGTSKEDIERQKQKRIDDMVQQCAKRRKGVCQDYAYLFQKMCEEIGIEAAFVTGFGRFSASNIGKTYKGVGNHAWNAVKLNGEWYLLDVTWSDGMTFGDQDYGKGFWKIDPEVFILSHHPTDEQWQLLEKPYSVDAFAQLPYMQGAYLKYDIKYITPLKGFISNKEKHTFQIKGPIDQYQLMIVVGNKPQIANARKVDDHYELSADLKGKRGDFHIAILEEGRVHPLLSMKIR